MGLGLGLAGGLAAAASRPAAPEPMFTPRQEPSYAYNPPPPEPPPPPPAPPPQEFEFMQNGFNVDDTPAYIQVPKGAAGNAAVQLPPPPITEPPPQPAPIFQPPQPPQDFFGGFDLNRDDRFYEQMFAKGGLVNLLRRR